MNTGHEGSLTTIHANTPRDALARLENMIGMADLNLPHKAARQQIASAITVVIQVLRLIDGKRKVTSLQEITGMEGEIITMQEIFRYEQTGVDASGKSLGRFVLTGVRPNFLRTFEALGIPIPAEMKLAVMTGAFAYTIYVLVFVAIVLAVEGAWLFARSVSPHSRELNRRLALINQKDDPKAGLELVRERQGGPLSQAITARAPWLGQLIWMSRAKVSPAVLLAASFAFSIAFVALSSFTGAPVVLSVIFGFGAGFGAPFALLAMMADRRRRTFLDQFPNAVDLVARSLQAGHPVPVALGIVAEQSPDPIGTEFGIVIDEMAFGLDRDEALSNMVQRFPLPELHLFVAAIQITRETGGNLAEVFLKLADVIRSKATLRKKVSALTAEGRLSCIILTLLPVALFAILSAFRPDFYGAVSDDPLFAPMMTVPPILLLFGAFTIWRMVNFKI
jgi:tight adherence protein B